MNCGYGEQATAWNSALAATVMAGDGAYDLVAGYAATVPPLVASRIFRNWEELPYIDFTRPWWSERVAEELTVNGRTYLATGDLSTALWYNMICLYFNKKVAEDYKIADVYGLVRDGKWTLDKLAELSSAAKKDLNGDGTMTVDDAFGLVAGWSVEVDCMKEAFEVNVTVKGTDGFPVMAYNSEHTVEVLTKLNAFFHGSDAVYFDGAATTATLEKIFSEDRALFLTGLLNRSEGLREMDSDFGIVPYPKWNEAQKSYHSTSADAFTVFLVTVDAKDPEFTAIITTAMAAENYRTVIPGIYEIALKTKNARDEDSAEMIDLIRDSLIFNFGYLYDSVLESVGHYFVRAVRANDNNVASAYAAKAASIETKLVEVLAPYRS